MYGHFGDGCVHVRIDFPFTEGTDRYSRFVAASAELVGRHHGSLSGEHGDGRARSALLPHMYSLQAIAAFGAVKHAFDPQNLLNPGVLVDPDPVEANLRVPQAHPLTKTTFAFPHDDHDLSTAVHRCVGVGKCRADFTASGGVMCPSYLATRDEKDSTRGRARVLQELANGSLVKGVRDEAVHESLDLCLSCKGCSSDCPAGVDMATYKAEVLHQRYKRRLRPASHYSLGWLPRLARIASRVPRLANATLRRPSVARTMKRLGGIDERRELPTFARHTFRSQFTPSVVRQPGAVVGRHLHRPLHARGRAGGGAGARARRVRGADHRQAGVLRAHLDLDRPVGRCAQATAGHPRCAGSRAGTRDSRSSGWNRRAPPCCAATSPSCSPTTPATARVAAATRTLAELLQDTPDWAAPDLADVRAVAQPHCHHHAVMGWTADAALLRGAGAQVDAVGGCCGLAGNFGVERGHYEVSVAVAENALLPAVRSAPADAVVLADGFSCRTQLDQLARVRSVHLAELLADHLEEPR